ncbi:CDP-alcohol phosphatidyltransferase family protein [Abyssalbus ytuae]|uniref:CDP-alcohol phosphatidyltransferase family protein n=1 Tax=Abyssalbus ytuae TaxID=2926907 RepID=A0A9E6ZUV8_9FLAO|nr:CDP-alcohol phosphatidyltransferase family protein [Abyssalbus ytuae]UOB17206.1 CDP-alcohol phosphatidyltransferase family protein [Abyssalbus ytuae]
MKKHIPNIITLLNLLCGTIAVLFAVKNELETAAIFAFSGIVFDFFDGLAARALKVQSELGVQLDSLADMVTCGVVPGIVMFQLFNLLSDTSFGWGNENWLDKTGFAPLSVFGLFITLASAYRLAKFNIDENQVSSFIGLPTPANTLFILSLPLILSYQRNDLINSIIINKWFLIIITVISCYMLNSKIQLFAFKFKNWQLKGNAVKYFFLLLSLIGIILLKFAAIPLIIIAYVITSLVDGVALKNKKSS